MTGITSNRSHNSPLVLRITQGRLNPYLVTLLILLFFVAIWQLIIYLESWGSIEPAFKLAVFFSVTITYSIIITHFIVKGHEKDLFLLKEMIPDGDDNFKLWLNRLHSYKKNHKLYLGAILMGLGHAALGSGPFYRLIMSKSKYYFFDVWMTILIVLTWFCITQASALFVDNLRMFSKLVKECKIDLLFTEKLAPFIRAGVRSTLAFMGAYALFPLLDFGDIKYVIFNPALLIFVPIVITMIMIPVLPLRRRIKALKKRELTILEKAIKGDKDALEQTRLHKEKHQLNIVDLITYKKFIEDIKDIPLSMPIAFRFLLYILLPLLTWVAASLVDKLVVALLNI